MIPFHTVCPEPARRETRSITVSRSPEMPAGEFAFIEWYCDDQTCDCRRVLLEVISLEQAGAAMAYISFGWEPRAYYEKWSVAPIELAREMARETTEGALDPGHAQSPLAPQLLQSFREMIAIDPNYVARLKRHYDLFRESLRRKGTT